MVATTGATTRFAWLFAITLLTTYRSSGGQPSQLIICGEPDSFTVQMTENESAVVYGIELLIRFPQPEIYPSYRYDEANLVLNNSILEFRGYMLQSNSFLQQKVPKRLTWISDAVVLASGTIETPSSRSYTVHGCRLLLPNNVEGSDSGLPFAVEDEVTRYARDCVETRLCHIIKTVRRINLEDDLDNGLDPNTLTSPGITPYKRKEKKQTINDINVSTNIDDSTEAIPTVDLNVNALVDIGVKLAVNYIKNDRKFRIKIPDVSELSIPGPFGVTYHFRALNGTFEDLSTLTRTGDALVSAVGQTHILNASFGLTTAKFGYDYYKLNYGFIKIRGNMIGNIDGIAMTANIILDYNQTCPINVKNIKVMKFGKITIKMTGLGPAFNRIASRVLTWLSNIFRKNITSLVEVNLKQLMQNNIRRYICDIYKSIAT